MAAGDEPLDLVGAESAKISLSRLLLVILIGFFLFHINLGLEVNIGKLPTIKVVNGSDVILPCTFSSCKDYKGASFWWKFQKNKTSSAQTIIYIKLKGKKPFITPESDSRVTFIGNIKSKNISLLLTNVDFDDTGFYTCFFKNPEEKGQEANATLQLIVVSELLPVDNTLTILILSIVGGVIGLLILIFIIKKIVMFIIKQVGKKKKECLVNSCANTEHGHYGSKADLKSPPKA
ncbi:sodium channel, voltage-gated, type IV, beta a [Pristis pectinata]|uniref:sodium channel, voltage-gated, type IV, beta a n=1 Tax=Pristis pectinata TaxID=685728 RepID=UPI00223E239B|nr:sodium channel, voltage-gated, type IV, beta a [Pristis pectinata]